MCFGIIAGDQDLGVLAGFGFEEVTVYKKPKVAIISTGDEVIPILPGNAFAYQGTWRIAEDSASALRNGDPDSPGR